MEQSRERSSALPYTLKREPLRHPQLWSPTLLTLLFYEKNIEIRIKCENVVQLRIIMKNKNTLQINLPIKCLFHNWKTGNRFSMDNLQDITTMSLENIFKKSI